MHCLIFFQVRVGLERIRSTKLLDPLVGQVMIKNLGIFCYG